MIAEVCLGATPTAGSDEASDRLQGSSARWLLPLELDGPRQETEIQTEALSGASAVAQKRFGSYSFMAPPPRRAGRRITMSAIRQASDTDDDPTPVYRLPIDHPSAWKPADFASPAST